MPLARPCLAPGCSLVTTSGSRCPFHEAQYQAKRNARRPHYHGDYGSRAAEVRRAANADPTTRCRRCGGLGRRSDPWQAGHVIDGDPTSPLAPEHRSCNAAAGGMMRG